MNLIFTTLFISLICICHAVDTYDESNSTEPDSIDVAKNFRRALIQALEHLEKEENLKQNRTNEDLLESDLDTNHKFGHKIRDKPTKHESTVTSFSEKQGKTNVFVHSFSSNIPPNHKKATEQFEKVKDNAISASLTSPIQGRSVSNKVFSSSSTISTVSVTPKTSLSSPNPTVSTPVEEDETKAKVEDVQFIHAPLVAAFTVQQDDKGLPQKVIPLYGSKTAQNLQDTNRSEQTTLRNNFQTFDGKQRSLNDQISQQFFGNQQQQSQNNNFSLKNSASQYQVSLEQKQRSLEEQIRVLQEQRRQQELLLQQQQALHLQTLQRQRLEEQTRLSHQNIQDQRKIINSQNRFIVQQNQNNGFNTKPGSVTENNSGTVVSLQPSITFQPNGFNQQLTQHQFNQNLNQFNQNTNQALAQFNQNTKQALTQFNQILSPQINTQFSPNLQQFREQQLPIKPAVNFQNSNDFQNSNQLFNQINQQQVPNQYRQNVFNQNNYLEDFFYRQRTLVPPPPRANRILRQETDVGNFGLNTFNNNNNNHRFNFNSQNSFNQFPQSTFNQQTQDVFGRNALNTNGFVPSNFFKNQQQQSNVDNRLKNLIYQSGLGQGRGQEDLNIVSKVLALDHTGKYNSLLFGE